MLPAYSCGPVMLGARLCDMMPDDLDMRKSQVVPCLGMEVPYRVPGSAVEYCANDNGDGATST